MRRRVIGLVVTAILVIGGMAVGEAIPEMTGWSPTVTARADSMSTTDEGELGTCKWWYESDGEVVHVSGGELPEAEESYLGYSPFVKVINKMRFDIENPHETKAISLEGPIVLPKNSSHLFDMLLYDFEDNPQIENWHWLDSSQTTNMAYMFSGSKQQTIDVSGLDTRNVTNMHGMFIGNIDLTDDIKGINQFDTSKVTDMGEMFNDYGSDITGKESFTLDLSSWDVSQVKEGNSENFGKTTGFEQMFASSGRLSIDLSGWQPSIPLGDIFETWYNNMNYLDRLTLNPKIDLSQTTFQSQIDDDSAITGNWVNSAGSQFTTDQLIALYSSGNIDRPTTAVTYMPEKKASGPVTIHFVDEAGETIQADQTLAGDYGQAFDIDPVAYPIRGYDFVDVQAGSLTGSYTADPQSVTLTYRVKPAPPITGVVTPDVTTDTGSESTESQPDKVVDQLPIAKKNRTITAVQKLGLYATPNFTKKSRMFYYGRQLRTNRPQFVIVGLTKSAKGTPRYLVKDVTPGSKRRGQMGYVTTNQKFWTHSYYQKKPKTIKVIAANGINAYRQVSLKGPVKHYKKGRVLRIKKLKRNRMTTRLQLSNGRYITANKRLVLMK